MNNPYHLNSLLLLANMFRMQEDITQSCDAIGELLHMPLFKAKIVEQNAPFMAKWEPLTCLCS